MKNFSSKERLGFIFLCSRLRRLSTKSCKITSEEFTRLLDKLHHVKASTPGVGEKLVSWNLYNNGIENDGIIALMQHMYQQQSALFPQVSGANKGTIYCEYGLSFGENPVSNEMVAMLNEEIMKQRQVSSVSVHIDLL